MILLAKQFAEPPLLAHGERERRRVNTAAQTEAKTREGGRESTAEWDEKVSVICFESDGVASVETEVEVFRFYDINCFRERALFNVVGIYWLILYF